MTTLPRTYYEVKTASDNASSLREMAEMLNYRPSGQTAKLIKKMLDAYGLSLPTGRKQGKKLPLGQILTENSIYRGGSNSLKRRLLLEGVLENLCDLCGNAGVWLENPLTLQLDHINGNPTDNRRENLRVLCPNCHTQTDTWGMKARK